MEIPHKPVPQRYVQREQGADSLTACLQGELRLAAAVKETAKVIKWLVLSEVHTENSAFTDHTQYHPIHTDAFM